MTLLLVAAGFVLGLIALYFWRRRQARLRHPKDFAFAVCTSFGPELRLPRDVRIRRVFPSISDELLSEWLQDFKRVDAEIFRLAREGGPERLGRKVVRNRLQHAFPFLVGRGLRQALFLVGFNAWHEGYDESPDSVRE